MRAEACTLAENYEHLLAAAFNMSFSEDSGNSMPQRNDVDNFDFDNTIDVEDTFDLGDVLAEELSRELNDAWIQSSQLPNV